MEYRPLGRSGLRVSEISLGSWLTYGRTVEDDVTRACILRAYELGINLFDTANVYHAGAAEESLGRVIRELPRTDLVIATKVFFPMGPGPNDRGLGRKHVTEQCHASLRRLGVEYVDLYQCHRFDPEVPVDETLRALEDLVQAGKVLYLGVSQWTGEQIRDAVGLQDRMGWHRLISNQPQYSMLARTIEDEVIPASETAGVGQIVWSPLAQGCSRASTAPAPRSRRTRAGPIRPPTPSWRRSSSGASWKPWTASAPSRARRGSALRSSPSPGCSASRTWRAPSSAPRGWSRWRPTPRPPASAWTRARSAVSTRRWRTWCAGSARTCKR